MRLSSYKQDVDAAENGREIAVGDGLFLTIARAGNKGFREYLRTQLAAYLVPGTFDEAPPEVFDRAYVRALATYILRGWRGLLDDSDQEIPYSVDTAVEILSDPAYVDLREKVVQLSEKAENFRANTVAGIVKK